MQRYVVSKKETPINKLLRFSPIFGAVLGLLLSALFLLFWDINPWEFVTELLKGAFGSAAAIGNTLNRAGPYMIIGAVTAITFKAGAQNMGQEGQVFMGGIGAGLTAILFPNIPYPFSIILALAAGMLLAALYAGIAVIFRLAKGINEVLTTLILNYVAPLILSALVIGPFRSSSSSSYPHSDNFSVQYPLTQWRNIGYLHSGIFIALAVVAGSVYFLWVSPLGLKFRVAGASKLAARTAGINPKRIFIAAMLSCGAFCGLAGGVELFGKYNNLRSGYATGMGWDALIVALLAGMDPKGVIPAALFFGILYTGINGMQRTLGVPSALLDLLQGLIMVCIISGTALRQYIKIRPDLSKIKREAKA